MLTTRNGLLSLAALAVLLPSGAARAEMIGVNFTGRLSNFDVPPLLQVESGASSADAAGVNGNTAWNDLITYHGQGVTGPIGPWPVTGAEGGSALVTLWSQGTWSKTAKQTRLVPAEDPSGDMMDGWMCAGIRPVTVNVSGLTSGHAAHDVYVYVGSSYADRPASITLDGSSPVAYTTRVFDGTFVRATGDGAAADYVVFPDVAGDSFTITISGNGTGLHGLEIVGTPEPSTYAMLVALAASGLGVYGWRWSRRGGNDEVLS